MSMRARLRQAGLVWWHRNDLNRLAVLFGTDKWGSHWYTQHYQRYFGPIRRQRLTILEIGVGGYGKAGKGGASLRMWKRYFPYSRIVGIDLQDKTRFREPRIDIRQCDQTDAAALRALSDEYGGFDIIIDDGSHRNADVIATFGILFPLLRANGLYAVEDLQTAYWPTWGGGLDARDSSMAFFKRLADGLNHQEFALGAYVPTYGDRHVTELAFFHNLVVVRKGENNEPSNLPILITRELRVAQRAARSAAVEPASTAGSDPDHAISSVASARAASPEAGSTASAARKAVAAATRSPSSA
jgi:hypothetical protein